MNVQTVFVSMLPEHLLLGGLCLVLVLDIAGRPARTSFALAIATVIAATVAAAVLATSGYAAATFLGHLSVSPATSAVVSNSSTVCLIASAIAVGRASTRKRPALMRETS